MADLAKLQESLNKRGFAVSYFETAEQAAAYLDGEIDGKTVGAGGSMTLKEMGLLERLSKHNTMVSHWKGDPREAAMTTQVYLSSVNGVAETGELVNIDGTGNRVSSTIYGHEVLYLVVGVNKVEPDFERALWRARNIASPKNAQKLGKKTPCALKGDKCYDCTSPERICRALVVLWGPPKGFQKVEVVLVNQALGL